MQSNVYREMSIVSYAQAVTHTCTSISSLPEASFTTEDPQANFLPNFLAASASLMPNRSKPFTVVTHLRLFLTARSMIS